MVIRSHKARNLELSRDIGHITQTLTAIEQVASFCYTALLMDHLTEDEYHGYLDTFRDMIVRITSEHLSTEQLRAISTETVAIQYEIIGSLPKRPATIETAQEEETNDK